MKKLFAAVLALLVAAVAFAAPLKKSVTWEKIRRYPAPLPVLGTLEPVKSDLSKPSWWSVCLVERSLDLRIVGCCNCS